MTTNKAKDLAFTAFWTEHPLSRLYAMVNGDWRDGVYVPASSWSIKQLIAFAEKLPAPMIELIGAPS